LGALFFLYTAVQGHAAGSAAAETSAMADSVMLPANSTGDIDFAVDAAGFKGPEGNTYMEFYFLLRPSEFMLEERKDKKYQALFSIDLAILDAQNREIYKTSHQRIYETDRPVLVTSRGEERAMVDQVAASIPPGAYRAAVTVTDLNAKREGRASKLFVADAYDGPDLMISDPQFSSQIRPEENAAPFVKSGLSILPNPMRIFEKWAESPADGGYKPRTMYLYFEIYNLAKDPAGAPSTYEVSYTVQSHTSGMKFPMPGQKNLEKPGVNGLKVLAFDYMTFPEDVYTLELTVRDHLTGAQVTRQTVFEVVQPPPPPPPVTVLSKDQAERGYRMLKYIASTRDLNLYQKLDLEGKTEFLINFWKERDPTPDTPENEFMILFNERFSFAEYQLGGAESDRGRIFMRYGEPEEIERHEADGSMKSYQIWYYIDGVDGDATKRDGGNRDFFVFGDRLGVGRYELLHCTAKNEVYNPDWRAILFMRTDQYDPNAAQYNVQTPGEKPGE
jgi:GWxTD domain-containing protein